MYKEKTQNNRFVETIVQYSHTAGAQSFTKNRQRRHLNGSLRVNAERGVGRVGSRVRG